MANFVVPHKFIAGTKAKAEEVNENFTALSAELDKKIENGQTVNINIEDATTPTQPVSKAQLDNLKNSFKSDINSALMQYCVHSGHCVKGVPTLFSISGSQIIAYVGGVYPSLVTSHTGGTIVTRTSLDSINMTGKANGTYNIFIPVSGNAYVLKNTVVYSVSEPSSKVENDVWVHVGNEPLKVYIYKSDGWKDFSDVFAGTATVASSTLSNVTTQPYCFNGHNIINIPSYKNMITGVALPQWSNKKSLTIDTSYVADADGYVCARVDGATASVLVYINDLLVATSGHYTSFYSVVTVEAPKGCTYKVARSGGSLVYAYFLPCIGGNL